MADYFDGTIKDFERRNPDIVKAIESVNEAMAILKEAEAYIPKPNQYRTVLSANNERNVYDDVC